MVLFSSCLVTEGRIIFCIKIFPKFVTFLKFDPFRWADLTGRVPPVAVILSAVRFGDDSKNLLADPVIVAQVLNTPSVKESDLVLYQSASNELRINGTG
jgi:hypothetical protein